MCALGALSRFKRRFTTKNLGSENQVKDVVNSSTNWSCGSERAWDGRHSTTAASHPEAAAVLSFAGACLQSYWQSSRDHSGNERRSSANAQCASGREIQLHR